MLQYFKEVKDLYVIELVGYNMNQLTPDVKRDSDNINRGRIDGFNLILSIGETLEKMKLDEQAEADRPKESNPGAY